MTIATLLRAIAACSLPALLGPITIDPATRDVVQTVYIRKVEKVNGATLTSTRLRR